MNRSNRAPRLPAYSAIEICVVMVILAAGLVPMLRSFSTGNLGVVRTESQFLGEQYVLELSAILDIMDYQGAKKFFGDLNSTNLGDPYVASLSPLKENFKRELSMEETELKDRVHDTDKIIKFSLYTIKIQIPGTKKDTFQIFSLTRMKREEVLNK